MKLNLPNKLSILRLVLIPILVAVFYIPFKGHLIVAGGVFALAAFTDFLDGYIARKYNLVTDLGKFLDSTADKVLVLSSLVLMMDLKVIPYPWGGICSIIIIAREILISCLRMVAAAKGYVMAADKWGKIKTILQDVSIFILITYRGFEDVFGEKILNIVCIVGMVIFGLSIIMAIVSAVHYFYVNSHALDESKAVTKVENRVVDKIEEKAEEKSETEKEEPAASLAEEPGKESL